MKPYGKRHFIINTGRIQGDINQGNIVISPSVTLPNDSRNANINHCRYDFAVSYASEQELYVNRTVKILEKEHINVFFAPNRKEEFLGRDMITEFYNIYRYESMFVACFISEEYLRKDITSGYSFSECGFIEGSRSCRKDQIDCQ